MGGATKHQIDRIIFLLRDLIGATSSSSGSALNFQGDYDVSANSPDLEVPLAGEVAAGDVYIATTSGDFFTQTLSPGDTLFAKVDDPTALTDWVIVQADFNDAILQKKGWEYTAGNTTTINPGLGAQDLLRAGGSFTNQTPFIMPSAGELKYISTSATSVGGTTAWEAHVYKNGSSVAQLNIGAGLVKGNSSLLSIAFAAGDEVRLRVEGVAAGAGVTGAGIDAYFKEI